MIKQFFWSSIFCLSISFLSVLAFGDVCAVSAFTSHDGDFDTSSFHLATGDLVMAQDCMTSSVGLWLSTTGSPSNRPINIYNDSAGLPNNSSIIVSSANIGAAGNQLEMRSTAPTCITAGTHFHVGIEKGSTEQYNVGYSSSGNSLNYGVPPIWNDLGSNTTLFEIDGTLSCAGSGTTTPTTIASSSPDTYSQSQENLYHSIILLMIGFFGMVWLIRKH